MNVDLIEKITKKTKAIVPVHFTGYMTNMPKLIRIAKKYKIPIVEDACQSILANINKKNAGTWGNFGAFSLHPLKNINVWSDGGIITTNNLRFYKKLKLLRNHGLIDRDTVDICGYNSRLDTFQSVVGNWLLPKAKQIANKRISNAKFYDKNFSKISEITIPPRPKNFKLVYHLYIICRKTRRTIKILFKEGYRGKNPLSKTNVLANAVKFLKYKRRFSVTDAHTKKLLHFLVINIIIKQMKYC